MKEVIFGTKNPGKLAHVQAALKPLGIEVKSIAEFGDLPDVEEDGKTAQENSKKKALFYSRSINKPVLSMDNALYIDGLKDSQQPGIHVRRIPGHMGRPTDEEVLHYCSNLIKNHGGNMTGHFEFAICFAFPDGKTKEVTAITKSRYFTDKISAKRLKGYPLESLQFDRELNKYVAEMTAEESDKFWQNSVGKELREIFSKL